MEEVQPQPVYRLVQGLQVLNKGGNVNLDAIFQSLVAADKEAEQNSPFRGFEDLSNNIGTMILKGAPDYNMGELLAGGLITGLVGGAAQNMTEGYRDKQNSLAQAVLQGSLTGNSIERPSGMSPSIYSGLNNAGSIFALERKLTAADEQRKNRLDSGKTVLSAIASANTPAQQQRVIDTAKALGIVPEDLSLPTNQPRPVTTDNAIAKTGVFPGSSLNDIRRGLIQQGIEQGLPGGAAQKEASDQMAALRAGDTTAVKRVEAARQKAALLAELSNTAEAGVQGAGVTGGFGWGLRDTLSKMTALVSPEEQSQRTSQGILDSVSPEIVKLNRSPGAVSDYETRLYLGAGPSSQNTPELNKALVEKMKVLSGLESEYADFLDAYMAEKGTIMPTADAPGAERLWAAYKSANPLFVQGNDGAFQPNTNRPSWREFFARGGTAQPDSAPIAPPASTTPATVTGETKQIAGHTYVKAPGGWKRVD